MKKYVFSLLVMFFAAVYTANSTNEISIDTFVQTGDETPQNASKEKRGPKFDIEQMTKELNLSAEQKTQMQRVFDEMRPTQKGETRPSKEEMEAKRKASEAKIKAILTDEQYAKFEKMRQNRKRPEKSSSTNVEE